MMRISTILMIATSALVVPACAPASDAADAHEAELRRNTLEKALVALGGREALEQLKSFTTSESTLRYHTAQGFRPEDPAVKSVQNEDTLFYDVKNDRLRIETIGREFLLIDDIPNIARSYTQIVRGRLGYLQGTDSRIFFSPGQDLLSDGTAAIRREQRLRNPHLILRDLLRDPTLLLNSRCEWDLDREHQAIVLKDEVYPITLVINSATGEIDQLRTKENRHVHRDSAVVVSYGRWSHFGGSVRFPAHVSMTVAGYNTFDVTRRSVVVAAPLAESLFEFPADANPVFDAALAARGTRSHQYHQTEGAAGFRQDGIESFILPVELAPGVVHLTGGGSHSMAIEQTSGIVLVEAPLYEQRSQAILDFLATRFPGKRVTHVITTHHHNDHTGGLRTLVAAGAKIVVGEAAVPYFQRTFAARSSIEPDTLSLHPVPAALIGVKARGRLTLADPVRPVVAQAIDNSHAVDMLVINLPVQKVLFMSDLFNPGSFLVGPTTQKWGRELYRGIVDNHLPVELIVGGHADQGSLEELKQVAQ